MADNFEEAKDDILLRTESNGGPTNRDMLKAMGALAKDVDVAIDTLDKKLDKQHAESVAAMTEHITYANVRDEEIADLQAWRRKSSETCVARVREIAAEVAAELHGPTHQLHMAQFHDKRRLDDPTDSEFIEERPSAFPSGDRRTVFEMIIGWSIFKWALAVAVGALIITGLNLASNKITNSPDHEEIRQEVIRQEAIELEAFKKEILTIIQSQNP